MAAKFVASEFEDLRDRARQNLITFLNTELDLGFTFVATAKLQAEMGNRDHFAMAHSDAIKVLDAIAKFEGRIADAETRRSILDRAAELKKHIDAL